MDNTKYSVDIYSGVPEEITLIDRQSLPNRTRYKGTFFAGEENDNIFPIPDKDIDIFVDDDGKIYGVM